MNITGYSSWKLQLPNIKLKKKTKSPENYRMMTPDSHNLLIKALNESSNSSSFQQSSLTFRPGSRNLALKNERLVEKTFSARFSMAEPQYIRKISPEVPTLKYSNIIMPKDLALMTQVRKNLISEISSLKIPNLTAENLAFFRNNFYPKELQNTKGAQAILQRNKAVKERKTRHPFATGAYGIKAMNKRTQRLIIDKLRTSLPEDSRFFQLL